MFNRLIFFSLAGFLASCTLDAGSGTLVVTNNTYENAVVSGVDGSNPSVPSLSQGVFAYTNQTALSASAGPYSKTINWPRGYEHITLP